MIHAWKRMAQDGSGQCCNNYCEASSHSSDSKKTTGALPLKLQRLTGVVFEFKSTHEQRKECIDIPTGTPLKSQKNGKPGSKVADQCFPWNNLNRVSRAASKVRQPSTPWQTACRSWPHPGPRMHLVRSRDCGSSWSSSHQEIADGIWKKSWSQKPSETNRGQNSSSNPSDAGSPHSILQTSWAHWVPGPNGASEGPSPRSNSLRKSEVPHWS